MFDQNIHYDTWSIDSKICEWLLQNLEPGKLILEFGSGNATEFLAKHWIVTSVEENIKWINLYHKRYVYAPIDNRTKWYDLATVISSLPKHVDLILVDGPAHGKRIGLYENIDLIDPVGRNCKYIIFDDVDRQEDRVCYDMVVKKLESNCKSCTIDTSSHSKKQFAIVELI